MRGFFVLQLLFLSSVAVAANGDHGGLIGLPIGSKAETQKRRELAKLRGDGATTKGNHPRRLRKGT